MNKLLFSCLFVISLTITNAQNSIHVKTVETFRVNFNNGDFEKIYQSFSTKMKSAKSKKYYLDILSRVKKENGSLLLLQTNSYRENSQKKSQGKYLGTFEIGNLSIEITTNYLGEILGLFIRKNKDSI